MSFEQIDDLNMYYEIVGDGEPILLIHGLGSSTRDWEYQLEPFSKNHKVITLDIRGHGQTTNANGEYSIALFAKDIAKLMQKLHIDSFHIVGLSMGGMLAFQLALDIPDKVKSITVVNSGPGFVSTAFKLKMIFMFRILTLKLFGLKAAAPRVAEGLFPNGSNPALTKKFIERYVQNHKPSYLKSMKALVNWNVTAQIHEINCPVLIVAADNDYTSVESKRFYTNKIPNAELVIVKNSHHALPVEKPDEFNPIVLDFLTKLASA
ncbi:MAG: alpha/beta hydrolase [Kangiellaceae bacterium]|nr:alpha/beta hydrolase [Kangiellaceae bacterium]